ncbi:MAG: hypothetical protein ABJP70_09315 [Erythrobacter sp.]
MLTPNLHQPIYCPALRFKAGELAGTSFLADDVAKCVLPRWIVPPPKERDEEDGLLFAAERLPDISQQLLSGWGNRECLIDVRWIIDEFGREAIVDWLPAMFRRARTIGCAPIPIASLDDLTPIELTAFGSAIDRKRSLKFALIVYAGELEIEDCGQRIASVLETLGVLPSECALIADASDSEFGNEEVAAVVLEGTLEKMRELGRWRHTVIQGTNYPDNNPAPDGGTVRVPRNEWHAWKRAVRFNPETSEHLVFGDFCADCSKIVFGKSGAPAIRHIRYALDDVWIVERGRKAGKSNDEMRRVFRNLVDLDNFGGERISQADRFIMRSSRDASLGCGNATTWRQLNTTRHITQTVRSIAKVRGIEIKPLPAPQEHVQFSLLE